MKQADDEDRMCGNCGGVRPHRWTPSPEAYPGWYCSECNAHHHNPARDVTVRAMAEESYLCAVEKGWHDEDETPPGPIRLIAWMGLICSEAAEAIEDVRVGRLATTVREDGKPEGFGSELADIIIRACDVAGAMGIDIAAELQRKQAHNRRRPHRHGGKKA